MKKNLIPFPGTTEENSDEADDFYGAAGFMFESGTTPYLDVPAARESGDPALTGVMNYLSNFLAQPNPALQAVGRPGNVCPFTQMALDKNAIRFGREAVDPTASGSRNRLKQVLLDEHLGRFFTEVEGQVADSRFASLLVLVDGLQSPQECDDYVSTVQKEVQPDFAEKRLLMSELHPHNTVPSLYNANFFPSGAVPHPIFFIRRIIERDIPFLARPDRYSPETVRRVRTALEEQFGKATVEKALAVRL